MMPQNGGVSHFDGTVGNDQYRKYGQYQNDQGPDFFLLQLFLREDKCFKLDLNSNANRAGEAPRVTLP